MTRRLVETLDRVLADAVQNFPREASVLVQFKAGDLADLKDALAEAKANEAKLSVEEPKPGIVLQPVPDSGAGVNIGDGNADLVGSTIPGEQPPA